MMLRSLYYILVWLMIFDFLLLMAGLYKPWIVLWWMPMQNRKRVIQLYGTIGTVLAVLTLLVGYWK